MTTAVISEVAAKVGVVLAAVSEVLGCSLAGLSEDELLDVIRVMEKARRKVEAFDHAVVAELEARNVPGRYVVRGSRQFLAGLLNLSPGEAGVRVRQAHELGSRVTLTGDVLPPLLPVTAQARVAGAITGRQVEVIIGAITKLRAAELPVEELGAAEAFLVEQAHTFDAQVLAGIARQLVDTLDPDGQLVDERRQQRLRSLHCVPNGDGMYRLTGDLDAETSALAMTVLHSLSAPKTTDGDRDERSSAQRMHDAFRAVLKMALRSGQLPASGGVPATVLITMTAEQFETRTGLATTSFGQKLTVDQALRIADQASIAWIVHNSNGGILNYGRTRRIATQGQTLALIARDKGCSFPGCTDPPEWTERHHIQPWTQGGTTDLGNMCLLCDHHHDRINTHQWRITMKNNVPWFTPPPWQDPTQTPQRNHRP
ncbi:MAG: HNH endonuclease [Actinomycetota bacterium]|nr:HNH endonuclease [Actinomycetota bacterium]